MHDIVAQTRARPMKSPLNPPKEEVEGRERKRQSDLENLLGPKTMETELRLGLSSDGNNEKQHHLFSTTEGISVNLLKHKNIGSLGAKRWFSQTQAGFGDSWKEEKAVFNQNNQNSSSDPRVLPVVGWPPIRTFRKNLAPQPKPKAHQTKTTPASVEEHKKVEDSMFVKVNMEGCAVGRKVNLKVHDSYDSLSLALQKMFNNFFSINCFKNSEQNKEELTITTDRVLIYEDNEGDRMLVGDVPWEMFIITVKRLYIISGSKAPALGTRMRTHE